MSGACGVLMRVDEVVLPRDEEGCTLPAGHAGPHLSSTPEGAFNWEIDLDCDCDHCQQCEGDYCITYWPAGGRDKTTE
jgi:hypothetical protein